MMLHDLVERLNGWKRIRGKDIPRVARLHYTCKFEENDKEGGKNYYYGGGTYFVKDDKYEYKIHKEVFAPDQGTRIPRAWTYRRALQ